MTHDELMAAVLTAAHELGLLVYHGRPAFETDPETGETWDAGFPDLVIAGPGGVLFVEVKSGRGRLDDGQWSWAGMLLLGGCYHQTWRPADWPKNVNEQLRRLAKV